MPHLGFTVSAMAIYSSCLKLSARAQPFDQYIGLSTGFKYTCVIDQAWGQVGGLYAKFRFCFFMNQNEVEVRKSGKERTRLISSHLDWTSLVNWGFVIKMVWRSRLTFFFLRENRTRRPTVFVVKQTRVSCLCFLCFNLPLPSFFATTSQRWWWAILSA